MVSLHRICIEIIHHDGQAQRKHTDEPGIQRPLGENGADQAKGRQRQGRNNHHIPGKHFRCHNEQAEYGDLRFLVDHHMGNLHRFRQMLLRPGGNLNRGSRYRCRDQDTTYAIENLPNDPENITDNGKNLLGHIPNGAHL